MMWLKKNKLHNCFIEIEFDNKGRKLVMAKTWKLVDLT